MLRRWFPYLLAAALSLDLFGCARTQIVSWRDKDFTVCGNRWAKQENFDKQAADRCGGAYRALAGGIRDTGDATVQSYGYGTTTVTSRKAYCVEYTCGG